MVYRLIIFTCLLCFFSQASAQAELPKYNLQKGEQYFLKQVMNLNTETEGSELQGNVSLDIISKIEFEVEELSPEANYLLKCKYTDLDLSFFSPQSDISISSQSSAFIPMTKYLSRLKEQSFHILMSPYGEFIEILELDSIINSFFFEKEFVAEKHDLIIKTIEEAFGIEAIRSMGNIVLNVYNDSEPKEYVKESSISFNAKSIDISNKLFYQALPEGKLRVQGIGAIEETEEIFEHNDLSLLTILSGNQTYDYLFDLYSGWPIEGVSKQKVHSLSIIKGHPDLPAGLKIPSFTETEYQFTGGKISLKQK